MRTQDRFGIETLDESSSRRRSRPRRGPARPRALRLESLEPRLFLAGSSVEQVFIPAANRVDMVHDAKRDVVYITTTDGDLLRYSPATSSFLEPIHLDGRLLGIDISPDQNMLVVADGTATSTKNWIDVVDLTTVTSRKIEFDLTLYELGTYTVAFTDNDTVLVSSTFNGSGSVPLRKVDLTTGTATTLSSVRQATMLTPSANHSTVAYAEANTSSGSWGRYRVSDGDIASSGTGWFTWEIGVNRNATQFAVPTYNGTYVYDQDLQQLGKIGTYASAGPIGLAYSPVSDVVYFAWADWNKTHAAIDAYDTKTLTEVATIDEGLPFDWTGNGAFIQGRLRISRDGSLLFATVPDGVKMYLLDIEPAPNSPPSVTSLVTASPAREGGSVSLTAAFNDPDIFDTHTAWIDWGDGTFTIGEVSEMYGSGTVAAENIYLHAGAYEVALRVTDDQGASGAASTPAASPGAVVRDRRLQVFGTPQSDNVTITAPARNRLKVTADFLAGAARKRVFAAAGVDGIDVFLFGGSDFAQIASNVKRWAFVDGGDGNDRLVAGGGWTVLVGGHGNDALTAGSGRDVLVGGYGRDVLTAGSAQSILLADATAFDSSDYLPGLPDELALLLILAEWNSKRSFATRRANLRDGSGSAERFNGDYFLQYGPTVFDDGVADRLIGSRKRNWWIGYP